MCGLDDYISLRPNMMNQVVCFASNILCLRAESSPTNLHKSTSRDEVRRQGNGELRYFKREIQNGFHAMMCKTKIYKSCQP